MKKITILLCTLLILGLKEEVNAQFSAINNNQLEHISQYYFSQVVYNPAYTGDYSQPMLALSSNLGKQREMRPSSFNLIAHTFIENANSGVGLTTTYQTYDNDYAERLLKLGFLFAYEFEIGTSGGLRVGFNTGVLHYNSRRPSNWNNPFNPNPTPIISINERFFKYNMDFGVLFRFSGFRAGVGLTHSNEPRFTFASPGFDQVFYRQAYASLSYELDLWDERLKVQPNVFFNQRMGGQRFVFANSPLRLDAGVIATFDDRYFAGVHYKVNQHPYRISLMTGIQFNRYMLTLNYDVKGQSATGFSQFGITWGLKFADWVYEDDADWEE